MPDDRPRLVVTLPDGAEALLSPLGPDDRELLKDGLDHLSLESRYNRFGQGRSALSEAELDYLVGVDQADHVAWGVAIDGEGAGVGRYIRTDDDCAEIAVTVLDEFQRRGLGRLLFEALAAVARADGVTEFCFQVEPDNDAVNEMIRGVEVTLDEPGRVLLGRVAIADLDVTPRDGDYVRIIEEVRAAAGLSSLRRPGPDRATES